MPSSTPSSLRADAHIWVTVLAGGVGSRFWPASRPSRPKQLLPLASDRPIVQETLDRALALVPAERVRVLAGGAVGDAIVASAPALSPDALLREPRPRGTAPVLAWAAWEIHRLDPSAVLVSLHSDHVIHPLSSFLATVERAVPIAAQGRLVTLGIVPDRPETGYGYIRRGGALDEGNGVRAWSVDAFVEKPDRPTAEGYLAQGYLWNSGIFVWKASTLLDQVREVAPEIGELLPKLEVGDVAGFFDAAPTVQIDTAVLERSRRVATVLATFSWDDLGTWEAMHRARSADESGNIVVGDAWIVEGGNNIVYADDGPVVVFGARDLVVVRSGGVTMVTLRERAGDLKSLVAELPARIRDPETWNRSQ